jgi:hypothetical protein
MDFGVAMKCGDILRRCQLNKIRKATNNAGNSIREVRKDLSSNGERVHQERVPRCRQQHGT